MPETAATPTTAAPADDVVQVWLTLSDQSKKLNREADLSFQGGGPTEAGTIVVRPDVLYQQMEGFGAAMTDSSAWLIMNKLDDAAREKLMRELFTREGDGIGLSYLRVPMGASDFALRDYTYNDLEPGRTDPQMEQFSIEYDRAYIIPALKLAVEKNPQLKLLGSPWSAPAWMKRGEDVHGGPLLPEAYGAFARYHVRFVQEYASDGLTINAITPQNEPMHTTSGYPTMFISAQGQAELIREYMGPAFEEANLNTKILIFDHNWDLVDYPLEVLADSEAAQYVDGVAFHCYGGDVSAQSRVHNAYPDKSIWFTECSGGGWATNWADNLNWNIRTLGIGNFRNWGNSLMLWNLALDENDGPQNGGCGNCRGVVTINQSTGDVVYNEEFYALGHISKFVDPGAYRIDSGEPTDSLPENVAFLNPDGSIVLIVQADLSRTFNVNLNGKTFSYSLPAKAVASFKWQAGMKPGPTVTPQATATLQATQTPSTAGAVPQLDLLLDFETPGDAYIVSNASVSLGDVAHSGRFSLLNESDAGEWHSVGANIAPQPLDLSAYKRLCFWVYDTTPGDAGSGNNTVGVRLLDASGGGEERWSDHAEVGQNPKTVRDQWVQMCMDLSAFSQVDMLRVQKIEFNVLWAGDWYFDDVTVHRDAAGS